MRPDLRAVTAWFAGDLVPDDTLAVYVSILQADPNWCITDTTRGQVRALTLLYYPEGVPANVILRRTADGWLPRVS